MASTTPVILILGSGPNIGQHLAQAFAAKGYKVALASRSIKKKPAMRTRSTFPPTYPILIP